MIVVRTATSLRISSLVPPVSRKGANQDSNECRKNRGSVIIWPPSFNLCYTRDVNITQETDYEDEERETGQERTSGVLAILTLIVFWILVILLS